MSIKEIFTLAAVMLLYGCANHSQRLIPIEDVMASRLDSLISAEEKFGFHGVVLVEKEQKIVLNKGYGYANEKAQLKFSPSTLVQIGSNVKDFTKVAIYQLVENNQLKLDDHLSKIIPGLTGSKQKITVQHLLDHKAGFSLGEKADAEPFTTAELITAIQTISLKSEPGTKQIYSNLGYSCLAYLIEQVSGQPYDQYVFDHIMKPIALINTGTYIPKFDRTKIAHGYQGTDDIGIILDMPHDTYGHLWSLRGNGGYLSTVEEMNQFYHALENNSLLKTEAFRLAVFNPDAAGVLAGSDMVSYFFFANMPRFKSRVVIASNHSEYGGNRLLRKIEGLLAGHGNNQTNTLNAERQIDLGNGEEKRNYTGPLLDKLPETGAGMTIRKYIDAFNTGEIDKMKKFFEDFATKNESALPINKRLEIYQNVYADMGVLTFVNLNASQSSEGIWEVSVNTANGNSAKFIFHLETKDPWKFEGLQISLGD